MSLAARWMPSCRDITELASDYLEGQLGWIARLMFRIHLLRCEACAEFVRQIDLVRKGLGLLPDDPMELDPQVKQSLLDEFRRTHDGE